MFCFFEHDAIGVFACPQIVCRDLSGSQEGNIQSPQCLSQTTTCYENAAGGYIMISDCTACQDGYQLNRRSQVTSCGTYYYNTCESACKTCLNCTSDTSWSSAGAGVQKKVLRTCNCGTCTETTSYRCAAGYYGSGSSCSPCPSPGTSSAGTTDISGCCIGAGISLTDERGTYVYSSPCCAS